MNVLDEVKGCIAKKLHIPAESISDNACLQDDLFADSVDILSIRLSIEDTFGIVFSEDELMCMLSVDAICCAVEKKVG